MKYPYSIATIIAIDVYSLHLLYHNPLYDFEKTRQKNLPYFCCIIDKIVLLKEYIDLIPIRINIHPINDHSNSTDNDQYAQDEPRDGESSAFLMSLFRLHGSDDR